MSVRACFGDINRPTSNTDTIVYANSDGLVTHISGIAINGDVGTNTQVLTSDGNGGLAWGDLQGQGVIPTLQTVMDEGNSAGTDLDMNGYNITSEENLIVGTTGTLELNGDQGIMFNSEFGSAGNVLTSNGPLTSPTWVAPTLVTAVGDLNMAGFAINNCAEFVSNLPITVPNGMDFTMIPTCPGVPTSAGQLTNKAYVDSTMAAAGVVAPNVDNHWSAMQTFSAGITVQNTVASFSAGAYSLVAGSLYNGVAASINDYVISSPPGALPASTQNMTWSVTNWGTDGASQALPDPVFGRVGQVLRIINMNPNNQQLQLYVGNGQLYNMSGGGGYSQKKLEFKLLGYAQFICLVDPGGNPAWFATAVGASGGPTWSDA